MTLPEQQSHYMDESEGAKKVHVRRLEVGSGCCCSVFSVIQVNGMKHQHLKD